MSEFSENKNLEPQDTENIEEQLQQEPLSTIFSAPAVHNDKKTKNGKKRLTVFVAALCSVAVLIGSTIAIIELVPERDASSGESSLFEDITVLSNSEATVKSVTVKNTFGEYTLYTEEVKTDETSGNTTPLWRTSELGEEKLHDDITSKLVNAAAAITAKRKIDTKTASECGFDNPRCEVTVTPSGDDFEAYTVLVGDASPDGTGSYLKIKDKDEIYIVEDTLVAEFEGDIYSLGDTSSLMDVDFKADTSKNIDDSGNFIYFDSLTLEGEYFPEKITAINNPKEGDIAQMMPYVITTPSRRYADSDNLATPISMFSGPVMIAGVYAFDVNSTTLAQVGLDKPDIIITLTIEGESISIKIKKMDATHAALVRDDCDMVYKVALENLPVINLKSEDYYSSWVSMNSINDIDTLEITLGDSVYNFDIDYTENDQETKEYTILLNGEQITTIYFQTFYQNFLELSCIDFTTQSVSQTPDCKFEFTFTNGEKSSIEFFKATETKYQYRVDGQPQGKITSTAYNKLIRNLKLVAANKKPTL